MAVRDYSGFQAIVNSVEKARESVEAATDRIVSATRDVGNYQVNQIQKFGKTSEQTLREKLALPKQSQNLEQIKQTKLLNNLDRNIYRLGSNLLWTVRRTQWQIQKATRPAPTPVQIAEKKFAQSLKNTDSEGKAIALAFRAATEVFLAKLDKKLEKSFPKSNPLIGALKVAGIGAAFPFASILFGSFSKIGQEIAKDFSKQLASQMQKTSKIDFGAMGGDVGQALGSGLQKGVLDFAAMVEDSFAAEGKEIAPKLANLIGKIFDNLILSIGKAGLALPRGYQRMQYQRLAIPQIKEMAGRAMIDRQLSDKERSEIQEKKSISIVVGGVNMDETAGNTDYVNRLMKPLLQGSHVVPVKNTWSNAPYDPKFKDQFTNLVKTALNTPVLGDIILKNIREMSKQKDSDFKNLTEEDFQDTAKVAQKVLQVMGSKDMPIGKGLEAVFKGYNPDDVKIAAEALYYRQQFPDMPINIVGTSFGGFNAAGATQLLEMMGVSGVKGAGITTPFTGIMSPPNEENFLGSIGTKDFLYQAVEEVLGSMGLSKEFQQVIEGAGIGHLLPLFLGDPKFQGRFQELFQSRFQFKKGIDEKSANYFSKRYQDPEDENLIRTVMEMAGMPTDEGYRYNIDDLKGFRKEISKKSKGVTDEDLKQEVKAFLDFIDAVIEELKTIGAVSEFGINAMPSKSIEKGKKAVPNFPDIEMGDTTPIPEEVKRQAEAMKNLVAFRQKLRGEIKNFIATLAVMQGQIPKEGWAFFDSGEEFDTRLGALRGFTEWLENGMMADASDIEKELAKPFLDFMKKLQTESAKLKDGGEFDTKLIAEFESLFGASGEINKLLTLSGENLQRYYAGYLQQIVETAKQQADQQIRVLRSNYDDLTIEGKREFARSFNDEIRDDARRFREALATGNRQLAREVGEALLAKIQSVKKIYAELIDATDDLSGKRSMQGQNSYLTALENEIIKGQPNRQGMSNTGLTQLVSDATNSGEETAQGFIQQVNADVGRAIGLDFARGVDEGTREGLDIQSPSKLFEQIGKWVVEGFNKGVDGITNALNQPVQQAVTTTDNIFADFISGVRESFDGFFNFLFDKFPILKELTNLFLAFGTGLFVSSVLETLVGWFTDIANASFDAVTQLESLQLALTSVTGSAEAGAKGLAFVREEAQRLGVELKTAEEAYTGFLAVTKYTALQGNQADRIFSIFQKTAATRGLSNEEQGRMFAAINQAISKRKLSAEEVRGQLGEIPGLAFESTVARSMGVNPAQLSEMMQDGLLMAEDVFPKVAALYEAENASISASAETTTQKLNRLNNAILVLQRSFVDWIDRFKILFDIGTATIEGLTNLIPGFIKALTMAGLTVFLDNVWGVVETFKDWKSLQALVTNFFKALASLIQYVLPHIISFLGKFALLTLAVDAWGAAIYVLSNNAFPELKKGIEEATDRANQLEQALQNVRKATQAIPKELPKTEEEIVTNRNWNILGWDTGFNLEGTRQFLNNIDKAVGFEALGFEPMLTTLGQQELSNFQENVGGLLSQVDKNLSKQFDVEKTIKEIRELDKELTKARSRQFNIPAGDKKRYEAAIKEQQKLIEERDKKLSVTASFEKALQGDKAEIKKYLKTLDELVARRGITEDAEKSIRAQLEQRLKDIDKTSTAFDDLMSNLQKSVNALTLALRNLNEQASYFNETLQRNATNARVQFMRRARAAGLGNQARDLGLDGIEQNTLEARIVFLRDQLGAVNELLTKPDFADVLTDLRQQAEDMGFNLENTATIDRLISENRSQQETAVLNTLKEQLRLQDELGQAEENLEQSISSTRSGIRDLNNSVEEFFFNLTQRIEEAIVEVDRILNKLKYTDIKNRLQRALVPGSDTFVNGLVSQIQGIFDRASGIVEQLLGQRSARINFVGERRGLQVELENFTRNLGGATEALELFRQGLLGSQPSGVSSQPSGGGGQPSASGRFALGKIGSTGIGSGPHLHLAGKDAKGNVMSKERLRELFSMVYVDGKPLSEQIDKITSGYGRRRRPVPGASTDHLAFDFGFPRGTPLEFRGAASSARSYFTSKNGNTVELTLPTGEKLLFLHLDSVADLGTIQRGRVNTPGNTTGNTPRRGMPNVPFASLIESAARQAGIDPLLFAALIKKESTFRQERKPGQILTSSANALGISQLKPETAKELGVNPYNVAENLLGGAKYLARMLERFGGNIELALSAYKAGPGNVRNNQLARGTVRDVGMVMQYYREFQQAGQVASANQPDVPNPPIPNVDNTAAQGLTNRLIQIKENQVNLGDADVRQEIESFVIQLRQTQQEILRQMGDSIRQSTQSVTEAQNSLQDIRSQYSPQTQSAQLETELRGVENQFRSLDNQLFEQERGLSDNIQGLDKLLGQIKPIIEILSASTNQVDQESASFLRGLIGRIEQDKTTYSGMLTEIQKLRGQLKEGKLDAENFVRAQAKLRTIQADLERIGTELSIAQQKNNLEQERAIALLQSRQQLELELLQISQDFEGEDRNKRLALAREQARLREQEIEYQFQSKSLSQETELINQRLAIAQNLSNLGKINELELLQSQKQLEQEILEIKKQYPDIADQERRINLAKEQARLREIGIENNFYNQRWQRQQELFDMESRIVEARATRLERSGQPFEAAAMREELAFRAELLRYEQEIEAIRQRYTDPADQQTRDELFRNAGILLELNLEQIDQQFKDLGETIRDTASGAFATFLEDTLTGTKSIGDAFLDMAQSILKSLAQIAARIAIGGLFRLLKLPIPGFADGGTVYPESSQRVPNFAEGDTVKSANISDLFFGNAQGNPFKGIQEALRKEGPQGVLAVFTPGEEILSLRTGEAQKYQSLKSRLGKNPLAKIGNFADGGTIGINESLLAGLNYGMPTTSRLPNNFGQTTQISNYGGDRSVTVNVSAPNPSAFNASERQIGRTIAEYLSRV